LRWLVEVSGWAGAAAQDDEDDGALVGEAGEGDGVAVGSGGGEAGSLSAEVRVAANAAPMREAKGSVRGSLRRVVVGDIARLRGEMGCAAVCAGVQTGVSDVDV
jgi:hypothetical protein